MLYSWIVRALMKSSEWTRLVRPVLPSDEYEWGFRGKLCYARPVGWTVRGLLAEGSAFDQGIYLWEVLMPLYVPTDVIVLSHSVRVGGGANRFDYHDPESIVSAASDTARSLPTDENALSALSIDVSEGRNRRTLEVSAYSLILLHRLEEAQRVLGQTISGTATTQWEAEIIERAQLVQRELTTNGLPAAQKQLGDWRLQSLDVLGLVP